MRKQNQEISLRRFVLEASDHVKEVPKIMSALLAKITKRDQGVSETRTKIRCR